MIQRLSVILLLLCSQARCQTLSQERVVFETKWGSIEFGFYTDVAPLTSLHIFKLVTLGGYNSNHFFRVHPGFVAQTFDVWGGRTLPLEQALMTEAQKTVPLEVKAGVKHTAGVLSMGRHDDPNSGTSSFSILLGDAPHLDMQYTLFGRITSGEDTLAALQKLETMTEGIFVMPKERVTIESSYWYIPNKPFSLGATLPGCKPTAATPCPTRAQLAVAQAKIQKLEKQVKSRNAEIQQLKKKCSG